MKILLATMSIEGKYRFEEHSNSAYSLGLGYISSYLKLKGHEVRILFLNNDDEEKAEKIFLETIDNFLPDIVGFQVFSMVRTSTFSMIEKLKEKNIKIVLGGIHVTIMYEQVLKKFPHVVIVLGEGEVTLSEIADTLKNNTDIFNVKGLVYIDDDFKLIRTQPRELFREIDSFPFPDHNHYFDLDKNRTTAHIISSRGCPFHCTFCALEVISKGKVRKRSINSVIEEIVYLKRKYPRIKHIQFHDDTMLLDNPRMIDFCKKIVDLKLGITYECSARVKPVSEELFRWMKKAGFTKIMFGLESGSETILKSIKKNIKRQDVLNLFHILKNFDFVVTTFLICGFPGETDETIQETIDLVNETQKLKYNLITGVGILWVYPGTEVYDSAKAAGIMTDEYWMSDDPVPYYTGEYTYEELLKFEEKIMNHVSLTKILTYQGFKNHFMKMPFIILRYMINNPRESLSILKNSLYSMLKE